MTHGGENIQVEFHNKANEIFFSFFEAFTNHSSGIDRRLNEYAFQEMKKKYVSSLEQELQSTAKTILMRHRDQKQSRQVDPMLRQFVRDYLYRFVQKINAL